MGKLHPFCQYSSPPLTPLHAKCRNHPAHSAFLPSHAPFLAKPTFAPPAPQSFGLSSGSSPCPTPDALCPSVLCLPISGFLFNPPSSQYLAWATRWHTDLSLRLFSLSSCSIPGRISFERLLWTTRKRISSICRENTKAYTSDSAAKASALRNRSTCATETSSFFPL